MHFKALKIHLLLLVVVFLFGCAVKEPGFHSDPAPSIKAVESPNSTSADTTKSVTLAAKSFPAKVIGVIDGDTIKVLKGLEEIRIRIFGVDCPEKKQPFGSKAKEFTSDQVFGKDVEIHVRSGDRYGRTVATVKLTDGRDLAALNLEAGLGWWSKKYAPTELEYERLENGARKMKRGLWSQANPEEPWRFRKR